MAFTTSRSPRTLLTRIALLLVGAALAWYLRMNAPPAVPVGDGGKDSGARATPSATSGFGADVGFRTRERWIGHWEKHGREFRSQQVRSADEYLAFAQALRDAPGSGDVLVAVRSDGVVTRFDRRTGTFIAFERDGTIRTCFRPTDGEAYFHRQAEREKP